MKHARCVRVLAAATTLVTAFALAACSSGGSASEPSSSSVAASKKPINLLLIDTSTTQELKTKFVPEFEKESGIKVNVDLVPEGGMDAKLSLSLGNGTPQYDVIEAGAKNLSTLVAAHWVAPLDAYIGDAKATPKSYISGFSKALLSSIQLNKKTYTMPYQVGADLLFYNKKMFKAAGLNPDSPPRTMDEIVAAAKKLNNPAKGQAGFVARGTRTGNDNSFSWLMQWFLNGGRWADAKGKAKYDVLTTPIAIKTTQQYTELMTKYAPPGATNYSFTDAQTAMQQGKAAMWLDAAQLGPSLEDKTASTIAGNVGYAAPEGKGDNYIVGAIWGFSLTQGAQNPGGAWKLIQFLTSKNVAISQAVDGSNSSPARSDALANADVKKAFNPQYLKAMTEAIGHANPLYSPVVPQGSQIRADLSLALSEILSGEKQIKPAMQSANQQIQELMK